MKSQSTIDRYIIFGKRKLYALLKSLEPSRIKGRFTGPRVLVNSLPKAGTNLLDRVLYNMPQMRYSGRRTLRKPVFTDSEMLSIVKGTKRGEYNLAHIQNNDEIIKAVDECGIKSLVMIRDPRQVIVSHYKYVTNIDTAHPSHPYFRDLENDELRKDAVINGVPDIVEPFDFVLKEFDAWCDHKNTLIVRFEDLIGENGGGSKNDQIKTVKEIATHLEIELTEDEVEQIAGKVFTTKSPTFRSGKTGGWKKEFTERQKSVLKDKIGEWLIKYGYEQNNDW
tara:strand:+ start:609 stop:1448 length:840 start_codon:yes stop_codon:yes gene_type:complete